MTKKKLPKYVYEYGGYVRFLRRNRGVSVMMKEELFSTEFWDHYNSLLKGRDPIPNKRTFETLALSYFESDGYTKLKPRTKSDYRHYIEHIRTIWGDRDPQKIETEHIYELHRANADHWRQANYLVQVMVILLNHARLIGFLKKEHSNPAKGIPLFKQEGEGWEPWPDDVRAEFEAIATPRARLVYELCIGTGQRIGDVLKMRWNDLDANGIKVMQGKTDKGLTIPLTDRLSAYLAAIRKTGLTIVTDANGGPAIYRTIAQEMRTVKAKMQHPNAKTYVTHGLRKNATIELYQAGCRDELVKAVTGHSSTEMLKKYGGAVRQVSFAREAQEARNRAEQNKDRT